MDVCRERRPVAVPGLVAPAFTIACVTFLCDALVEIPSVAEELLGTANELAGLAIEDGVIPAFGPALVE